MPRRLKVAIADEHNNGERARVLKQVLEIYSLPLDVKIIPFSEAGNDDSHVEFIGLPLISVSEGAKRQVRAAEIRHRRDPRKINIFLSGVLTQEAAAYEDARVKGLSVGFVGFEDVEFDAVKVHNQLNLARREGKMFRPLNLLIMGAGPLGECTLRQALVPGMLENFSRINLFSNRGEEAYSKLFNSLGQGNTQVHFVDKTEDRHGRISLEESVHDADVIVYATGSPLPLACYAHRGDEFTSDLARASWPALVELAPIIAKTTGLIIGMSNAPEPIIKYFVEKHNLNPSKITSFDIDPLRMKTLILRELLRARGLDYAQSNIAGLDWVGNHGNGAYTLDSVLVAGVPLHEMDSRFREKDFCRKMTGEAWEFGLRVSQASAKLDAPPKVEIGGPIVEMCRGIAHYQPAEDLALHGQYMVGGERVYIGSTKTGLDYDSQGAKVEVSVVAQKRLDGLLKEDADAREILLQNVALQKRIYTELSLSGKLSVGIK